MNIIGNVKGKTCIIVDDLGEEGGPEFTIEEVKAIAASFDVEDGPNNDGEMFIRPGRPSDKFVSPYPNVKASMAANGGAYPPRSIYGNHIIFIFTD